jgi:hypothetical protein
MKSRSEIWFSLLDEIGRECSASTSFDKNFVERRITAEGESFLTIALPAFHRDFLRSLEEGRIPSDAFIGFSRRKLRDSSGKTHLGTPKLFGGFLDMLFTSERTVLDGEDRQVIILDEPELLPRDQLDRRAAIAAKGVRQLCLLFSKEKSLCSPDLIEQAIDNYVEVDGHVIDPLRDSRGERIFASYAATLRRIIRVVFGPALISVDRMVYTGELVPRHGPGATADNRRGNYKWTMPYWYSRLDYLFPYREYALPNMRFACEDQGITWIEPEDEIPTKLVPVPKTQTTPRLIAEEPTVMQYLQQAISAALVPAIESNSLAGSLVSFTDQTLNQRLAEKGSRDGSLATLDLSEASDRVANWLVEELFGDYPNFLEAIQTCRSTKCQLPSGKVITLMKFASMGSALTFPIESMIFTSLAILGCLGTSPSPTLASIKKLVGSVRVYGDDIIIPANKAVAVSYILETFGFKVNRHKSFWTGSFRESCGKEYFAGFDVSIVKSRESLPSTLRSARELVSLVSFRNLLCEAGWLDTVDRLDTWISALLKGHFPYVSDRSPLLGRVGPRPPEIHRWNKVLHRFEVRGFIVQARIPHSPLDEVPALTKCLMHPEISQYDISHLSRSGRPRAVGIKLAWVQA